MYVVDLETPAIISRRFKGQHVTSRIVSEKAHWSLSFDKWQFEAGAGISQQLRVEVTELGLPVIPTA